MNDFNASQQAAIAEGVRSRMTLIQGPPGTGKTRTLAGIVLNLFYQNPFKKILVATTMNYTADLLAEELYKLDYIKSMLVRTYSQSKEDIFNVVFDELREYSVLYKMIYDKERLAEFQKRITEVRNKFDDFDDSREARAKY